MEPIDPIRRILVVEDDHTTRTILSRLLADAGHAVWTSTDTLRGLRMVREHHPDRMLLDLMLPGQPGEHLLHAVRSISPETRVAVLTAVDDPDRLSRLAELGVDRVLRKPVDLDTVLDWLREE